MTPRRVFLSPEDLCRDEVTFPRKTAHYLRNVLRLRTGDCVEVFSGQRRCVIRLTIPAGGEIRGEVIESKVTEPCVSEEITLAFSCVRPRPVEEILRHGTELGVSWFVPILAGRANRRPRETKQRWESIIVAAAAQSGRTQMPALSSPLSFIDFVEHSSASATKMLLSTESAAEPILAFLENHEPCEVTILVGPEGGLYEAEQSKAVDAGFHPVSLGTGVLRAETAAVTAAATVAFWRHWSADRRRIGERGD